jgi:hypothetical protein
MALAFMISRSIEDPLKIEFNPPRGTDALFDALRQHYPDLGTHQLRLQKAVIEFHTREIERETSASYVSQEQPHLGVQSMNILPPTISAMEVDMSRGPAVPHDFVPSIQYAPNRKNDLSHFHSMLGSFKKSDGSRKGHRRRPMDPESRKQYTIVKRYGACAEHRKTKKKARQSRTHVLFNS